MSPPWTVWLPYTKPPLSMNQRLHFGEQMRLKKQIRSDVGILIRSAGITPQAKVRCALHYIPKDKRTRDPLNLVATLKPVEDGLVDAGVIPDDNPTYLEPCMPIIDPPDSSPTLLRRLYLVITPLEP